ncbi:hypothetical protein B296_00049124 [Ensete ventricosum]|uniref:RING-type domain-containing protein n=1 Tax=Ensete ventricosum TaxID=4639 RepID=A0A426YAA6_ENSVE|nr:hypothetical protein B296_00049124 [Ensete ventricosum]
MWFSPIIFHGTIGFLQPKFAEVSSRQICQICGDDIEVLVEEEFFVACNECAFPVCRTCYEYERREGTQACPQCKSRYKRHKGSPRVEGDEEEDGDDDLEKEFNFGNFDLKETLNDPVTNLERPGGVGQSSLSGLGTFNTIVQTNGTNILLLTDGEEVG